MKFEDLLDNLLLYLADYVASFVEPDLGNVFWSVRKMISHVVGVKTTRSVFIYKVHIVL
jgi:hypothetical protein